MTSGQLPRGSAVRLGITLAALLLAGCSPKDREIPVPTCQIKRADADDMVQILAATIAADGGGWYFTVKALAESLVTETLPKQPPPTPPVNAHAYSLTRAGVTYDFQVLYFDSSQVRQAVRDSATDFIEADVHVNHAVLNINGVEGTYGCHADTTYSIYVTYDSDDDILFSGILTDSSFSLVNSQLNPGNPPRLWYFGGTTLNIVDYDLHLRRSRLPLTPYPFDGQVSVIVDASGMGSYSRDDVGFNILAEANFTFDGTNVATVTITDSVQDEAFCYKYTINLDTGAIARVP